MMIPGTEQSPQGPPVEPSGNFWTFALYLKADLHNGLPILNQTYLSHNENLPCHGGDRFALELSPALVSGVVLEWGR